MTTAQIIILGILFLILSLSTFYYFRKAQKHDYNIEDIGFLVYIIILSMVFIITISSLIKLNESHKEMKCPEYEKVENVYKLK